MTGVFRWGILGPGNIAARFATGVAALDDQEVIAVGSRTQASADRFADRFDIVRRHVGYEALVADPNVDAIYVATPHTFHHDHTRLALQHGKHVLCEKPLAITLGEVDAMITAAQATGRVLMEAFMYRHHAQTLKVQELVQSGALGELRLIKGAFSFNLKNDGDVRLVRAYGGGSLWDVGCYPVSYCRTLAGAPVAEVYGQKVAGRDGVDEIFTGELRFANGVVAQFDSGFALPGRWYMEIVGSEGTLSIPEPYKPGINNRVTLTREGGSEIVEIPGGELYAGEVENMADAILTGAATRVSLADSRANVATLLGLYRSADVGAPVVL